MRFFRSTITLLLTVLLAATCFGGSVRAAGELSLYTPYAGITVAPGESIDYSIDLINNSADIQTVGVSVDSVPADWKTDLTAGGRKVDHISVKPKESQSLSLDVTVPVKVDKGTYQLRVNAGGTVLPLSVTVSETGTYTTELETSQPNMEGKSDSTFTYSSTLRNKTASKQLFALKAEAPQGWNVSFSVDGKDVTSVELEAGASKDISISATPPDTVKAGSYKIPVTASGSSSSAKTELEAVVTGTYAVDLSTVDGNLNVDITAGSSKTVTLQVTNKGSSPLSNVTLSASTPANWEVTFEPSKINSIPAGQSQQVTAHIKADKKAIAGDYMLSMTAQTAEKSADATFRMTVHTSVLWGWIAVLIILAVIGGVYYLFRKYGRR